MNFIILGAGTVGCYVGGRLAHAGERVTLVGRPRVLDALAANGLTVTDLDGFKAHIAPAALGLAPSLSLLKQADFNDNTVILLCVKSGATATAALEIAQNFQTGTTIVSLQNGVDNMARIRASAPQMLVLAGMVPYNVVMNEVMQNGPHVHRATGGHLQIESTPEHPQISQQVASALNAAGIATVLSGDMHAVQWGKLLLNLNNPVNALSGLPLQAQLQDSSLRRVLADLQTEALRVLAKAGISPAQVATVSPRVMPHLLRLPNWVFTRLAARMLRMDARARSSMWDDLQQGRATEIDDLCGAVVRLAQAHGSAAPLNARMCALVAKHTTGQRLSGVQMGQALSVN